MLSEIFCIARIFWLVSIYMNEPPVGGIDVALESLVGDEVFVDSKKLFVLLLPFWSLQTICQFCNRLLPLFG